MKRKVSRSGYEFLKTELNYLESTGHLEEGQSSKLMDLYEPPFIQPRTQNVKMNAVQILMLIGGILIGLGILSFVASNWSELTKVIKFSLLMALLITFYLSALFMEKKIPSLSRAIYYMGAFTFGAEIFYIGQMFHLGMNVEDAFLLWGIGLLPLVFYSKDTILKVASLLFIYTFIEIKFVLTDGAWEYLPILIIPALFAFGYYMMENNRYVTIVNFFLLYQFIEFKFIFAEGWISYLPILIIPALFALNLYVMKRSQVLMFLNFFLVYQFIEMKFIFSPLSEEQFPYVAVLLLPVLFYIGHKIMNKSQPLFVINFILALQLTAVLFYHFRYENITMVILFYFTIWMVLTHYQHPDYGKVQKSIGTIMHFPTALLLSFPMSWYFLFYQDNQVLAMAPDSKAQIASVIFSVLYLIFALTLVKRESLYGVAIVSVFIFRFYVDLSLAFMDKSIAFIMGGILLVGLGLWFEKTRRKEMGTVEKPFEE